MDDGRLGCRAVCRDRRVGGQGLSFAVPIDVAINVKEQLLKTGHVTRGRLGLMIQDVSQGLADSFGLKKPEGALVSSAKPGSTAMLDVWHQGSVKEITVTVGELEDHVVASANDGASDHGRLGLVVRPLTPADCRKRAWRADCW